MTVYGNDDVSNMLQAEQFPSNIILCPIGPISTTGEVTVFGIASQYWSSGRDGTLVIYERDMGDISLSSLVAASTPINFNPNSAREMHTSALLNGTVLEAGKSYLIGVHGNAAASTTPRTAYDGNQAGGETFVYTGFAYGSGTPPTLGRVPDTTIVEHMSVYVNIAATGLVITSVNGNNTVTNGQPIVIYGELLSGATDVDIGGHTLSILTATDEQIECAALQVFDSPLPFGGPVNVTVSDGATQGSQAVTVLPSADIQYVDVAGVQPYLSAGLAVLDGHQMAAPAAIGALYPNTDFHYSPAMPHGGTHDRYWYHDGTWDLDDAVVFTDKDAGDRNTTSVTYEASSDGTFYFKYPDGDSP